MPSPPKPARPPSFIITCKVGLHHAEAGPAHALGHRLGQRAGARQRHKRGCGQRGGAGQGGAHGQATRGDTCSECSSARVAPHGGQRSSSRAAVQPSCSGSGAPGCICVAISSARPSVVTPSAAMRHIRGSSSNTEARRPPCSAAVWPGECVSEERGCYKVSRHSPEQGAFMFVVDSATNPPLSAAPPPPGRPW